MVKFKNPTTGITVEQEGRSIEDLANQGFQPVLGINQISESETIDQPSISSTAIPEISLDSLEPTEQVKLPDLTTPQEEPDLTIASAGQTVKTVEDYIKELTPVITETQEKEGGFLEDIADLTGQLGQKPIEQLKKEEELGVPELRTQFADINAQILTRTAEYEKLKTDIEGKPIPMSSIIGQQAQAQRAKASEIGLLQARALGLQGQITTAQATANRAIDLKYSVIENNLDIYEAQLRAIQPQLNREQQILAQAQQEMINNERLRVAEEKAEGKSVQGVASIAQQNGADGALLDQIGQAKTQLEAQQIAGELAISEGWQYVAKPVRRDELLKQGYEMTQSGGRTYMRKPDPAVASYAQQIRNGSIKLSSVPADLRDKVSVAVGGSVPASGGSGTTQPASQGKSGWSQPEANKLYDDYIKGGYDPSSAINRVQELTGYIPKGANYSASTILSELKSELIANIQSGATLANLSKAYQDVSSSYLNSLYNQYKKEEEEKKSEDAGMTDEEFLKYLKGE